MSAAERALAREKLLYDELIDLLASFIHALQRLATAIASLDVFAAQAELAVARNFVAPEFTSDWGLRIAGGRHPVVEPRVDAFIANDLLLDPTRRMLVVTGPNMGGKSTYLRQTALIALMAQAGYFVPAARAEIGLVDRIFTRIGAADALVEGKSTFLVEMIETAVILNNATERSLILLDEIGRGTSTYDGLSIAWAVVEHLHALPARPRTLFATHYHELTELAEILDRVRNLHISVKEWQDSVIFLHKIVPGATDQSFGIHVAKIAGIPAAVIERAKEILLNLEKKELNRLVKERLSGRIAKVPLSQKSLFPEDQALRVWDEIRAALKETEIAKLTPLEALNLLNVLKKKSDAL
jgi:DNA mismatch repair protein MutS